MTYSIVARDEASGAFGCAVQSHFFAVGPIVPWAEPGVGVVATQAHVEVSYGPRGLELMRSGTSAPEALASLVAADDQSAHRQVAMIDAQGSVATHTGTLCIAEAGHCQGRGVSVQANMMTKPTVPAAMLTAYQSADLADLADLADRLLAALDAAQAEGGDIRGQQSAALLVVDGDRTDTPWQSRVVDLRVDDHPEPLTELRRLLTLRRCYDTVDRAEQAALRGDIEAAAAEYAKAEATAGDNVEATFWHAVELAKAGRATEAREKLTVPFARHDGWRELLRRLPAAGMFPSDPTLMDHLLND